MVKTEKRKKTPADKQAFQTEIQEPTVNSPKQNVSLQPSDTKLYAIAQKIKAPLQEIKNKDLIYRCQGKQEVSLSPDAIVEQELLQVPNTTNTERKSPIKDSASTNQDPAENYCVSANPLLTSEYKFQDGLSDPGKNKKIMAKLIVNKGVTPIALKLEKILEPKRHEVGTKISLLSSSRQAMKNNV